jgi:class 3 adenylate cyclase
MTVYSLTIENRRDKLPPETMEQAEPTRKTRAIMFSDIQGYSRLMGEDESLALRLLEEHNSICVPLIQKNGGTILKFIGDAILSSFESASDAVHCGMSLQRLLAERNASRPDIVPLVIRIGIHIGDVVFKDGDVFGDGVNIAARIEPLAEPGGVAISQTVYDMIKARPEIQTVNLGSKDLKNIKEAINIYKVLIEAQDGASGFSVPRWAWAAAGAAVLLAAVLAAVRSGVKLPALPVAAKAPAAAPAANAPEWDKYAAQHQLSPEERKKLMDARDDAYWGHLRPLLLSPQVSAADKSRWAEQFYQQYHESPGLNLAAVAEFVQFLPPGPARDDVAALAKTPAAVEASVRSRLKTEAAKQAMESLGIVDAPRRQDFFRNNPFAKTGHFDIVRVGEPVVDRAGNIVFEYTSASGQPRKVAMSAAMLKDGAAGDAALAKGAQDLAKDYLSSEKAGGR